MEESYFVYAQRLDLPSEVMCSTICGEHNLDSTKKFIRQRIAQENKKFAKGINPWKLKVEKRGTTYDQSN